MCFSAQASFIASAGLTIIGIAAMMKARTQKMRLFAASPLFFAAQQALEGIVWVTLARGDTSSALHTYSVYGYLFFASIFWPLWVPDILYYVEQFQTRKSLLTFSSLCGILVALFSIYLLSISTPKATLVDHHIAYDVSSLDTLFPFISPNVIMIVSLLVYVLATVVPFFISSIRYLWIIGILLSVGFMVSFIFYQLAFGSVWCFFAALASIGIYLIV